METLTKSKTKAFKTSSHNVTMYVFRDSHTNRTNISLYINVEKTEFSVVLKEFSTKSIKGSNPFKAVVTSSKGIKDAHFESTLTFQLISNIDKIKHTAYFEYQLPGFNHNVVINTPYDEQLLSNYNK